MVMSHDLVRPPYTSTVRHHVRSRTQLCQQASEFWLHSATAASRVHSEDLSNISSCHNEIDSLDDDHHHDDNDMAAPPPTLTPPTPTTTTTSSSSSRRVLVVYGSQSGNAERLASRIHERLGEWGYPTALRCLDQVDGPDALAAEAVCVAVVSTHYEGDPPDNAARFWRRLKARSVAAGCLAALHFAVLGACMSVCVCVCVCTCVSSCIIVCIHVLAMCHAQPSSHPSRL
jgi:sulfite reductase alpha subunit-like flavoprotein